MVMYFARLHFHLQRFVLLRYQMCAAVGCSNKRLHGCARLPFLLY